MKFQVSAQYLRREFARSLHTLGIEPRSQAWEACKMPLHYMCLNKICNRNISQLQSFLEQCKTRHKTKQHSLQDPRKHLSDKRLPTMRLGDACHASLFSRRILQKFISGTGVGKTSQGAAEQNSLNRYFVKSSKKEARGQSFQIDRNF